MLQPLLTPRQIWLLLAGIGAALVVSSLVLTSWQNLHPCHLCIFQRLLYLLLAGVGLGAGLLSPRPATRWVGFLALPLAAGGLLVAGYQSWLQAQPAGSVSCVGGDPSLIERVVEWLGQLQPELFLATGFCADVEMTLMKLSLANWSAIGFAACLALAWRAWRPIPERRLFKS
jgi:disulfide bond formation protein DsbB